MREMHSTLDRLEARLDYQAARIDALYRLLGTRGVLPARVEDEPLVREIHAAPARHAPIRLHVGDATGV
jgi:hypothetical protein